MTNEARDEDPIKIGDPAPDFRVPAVNRDGDLGLADYTDRRWVLLGLFRGLHCPFCRRQVVQMSGYSDRLAERGVGSLAIINTELNRAKSYYSRLKIAMALGVDPAWDTHRRYGIDRMEMTFGKTDWPRTFNLIGMLTMKMNPTGELPKPVLAINGNKALNRLDGFELTDVDKKIRAAHGMTGSGFTLIDKHGTVRWRWLEGHTGIQDIAKFPSADDIVKAIAEARG